MSLVTLVSGGLDSTLVATLIKEEGISQFPLFINYGQLNRDREFQACSRNLAKLGLPAPTVAELPGYGQLLPCGLTSEHKRIVEDAFLPGRNLLFLLTASAFAYQKGASGVAVGLLTEEFSIFPDQTKAFLERAESMLGLCLGRPVSVLAPLIQFSKRDVVAAAQERGIDKTYSCHAGTETPCANCIACREYDFLKG